MKHSKKQSILLFLFVMLCQHAVGQYIPFCESGKWGFASTDGKITIPCIYQEVDFYSDDNLARVKKAEKYGYVDKNGAIVIPFQYDNCIRIYEVYHGHYNIGIKYNPAIHLNRNFDFEDINNNRYIVSVNKIYGIISLVDGKPKVIAPLKYSKIQFDPDRKIFHCSAGASIEYINTNGQKLTKGEVGSIGSVQYGGFGMGMGESKPIILKVNGKVGVIQCVGRSRGVLICDTLVPVIYDDVITKKYDDNYISANDVFAVKIGEKWGIVKAKNNVLLPIQFDSINFELSDDFSRSAPYQRLFVIKQNGKWGITGKKNDSTDSLTTLLAFEYESINKIHYTYLLVKKDNKFQVYNTDTYKLINNKSYSSITKYEYGSVNDFDIFEVTNKLGQKVYLGKNGVEFFTE